MEKILVINPGATTTKLAVYQGERVVFEKKIEHIVDELKKYKKVIDQFVFRQKLIIEELKKSGISVSEFNAVVARGGLLKPIPGGTYYVNDKMISDLINCVVGEHAANLGAIIADSIAKENGIPAFIVDPICVDELDDEARLTGLPQLKRQSLFHALNHKAVARKIASGMGKKYQDINLIIAHLGTGISIAAHRKGKAIDVNNARDDGPFSLDRCGSLPTYQIVKMCYSGEYSYEDMREILMTKGGMFAYLGTKDFKQVEVWAKFGDYVYSPIIDIAEADIIVAFEKSEAVRYLHYLKPGGTLIINDYEVYSQPVLFGAEKYPEHIIEQLRERIENITVIKAAEIAKDLGNFKVQNIVLLGVLIKLLSMEGYDWPKIINELVLNKLQSINIKAFNMGLSI